MVTLSQVADNLSKAFIKAPSKKHAAQKIILEINSLRFAESKELIDKDVKQAIIYIIEIKLQDEAASLIQFQKLKPFILQRINVSLNRSQQKKVLLYWLKRKIKRVYKLTLKVAVTIIGMKSSNIL